MIMRYTNLLFTYLLTKSRYIKTLFLLQLNRTSAVLMVSFKCNCFGDVKEFRCGSMRSYHELWYFPFYSVRLHLLCSESVLSVYCIFLNFFSYYCCRLTVNDK